MQSNRRPEFDSVVGISILLCNKYPVWYWDGVDRYISKRKLFQGNEIELRPAGKESKFPAEGRTERLGPFNTVVEKTCLGGFIVSSET